MNLSVMADGSERIHYRDPAVPIYICYGNLRDLSNMAALCHWHGDVELLMPVKGYLSYNVNGKRIGIAQGNAIFVNARQMHYGFSADGTDCEYICVCFKPDLLCANEEIRSRYVLPVMDDPGFPYLLLEQENPEHRALLEVIRELPAVSGQEMAALGRLYMLWQGLFQLVHSVAGGTSDGNVDTLKRMLEFIRTHYPERISLGQIAASGGVCRSKCCQIFRRYLNRSPNDYLNSLRLEKGMELLHTTDAPVTEIAYACGFGSASYFTELFSGYKGCTPTAYRKRSGESPAGKTGIS